MGKNCDTDAYDGRRLTDGSGDDDETEEETADNNEETDAPPSPPRDSKEGQTQAPERDEEDLIGTTAEESDEERDKDESEDENA